MLELYLLFGLAFLHQRRLAHRYDDFAGEMLAFHTLLSDHALASNGLSVYIL